MSFDLHFPAGTKLNESDIVEFQSMIQQTVTETMNTQTRIFSKMPQIIKDTSSRIQEILDNYNTSNLTNDVANIMEKINIEYIEDVKNKMIDYLETKFMHHFTVNNYSPMKCGKYSLAYLYILDRLYFKGQIRTYDQGKYNRHVGNFYRITNDVKTIEYYLKAIEKKNNKAINSLAYYYSNNGDECAAIKYYNMGVENGLTSSMNNLALIYKENCDFEQMHKMFLMAISHNDATAMCNYGEYFNSICDIENMLKYYNMASNMTDDPKNDSGRIRSLMQIGLYYVMINDEIKAEEIFERIPQSYLDKYENKFSEIPDDESFSWPEQNIVKCSTTTQIISSLIPIAINDIYIMIAKGLKITKKEVIDNFSSFTEDEIRERFEQLKMLGIIDMTHMSTQLTIETTSH
jgi:tetratricopeptide (TPR) repeat protein